MPEIDKIKEEIGWLKIVFGLLIVTDISLLGWIARNIFNIHVSIFQYWNEPVEREILSRSQARLYSCSWMVVKSSRRACCSASAAALSLIW